MNAEELEWRKRGIGGSDIHHIFNMEPYGCALKLWREKRREVPDYPESVNKAMLRGTALEDVCIREYTKKTGNAVVPAARHIGAADHYRGHADGIICPDDMSRGAGILECKVVGKESFYNIMNNGLPAAYILQMQWYLYIYDLTWGAFAILWADGWELETFTVSRDQGIVELVMGTADCFWEQVESGNMPPRLAVDDARCRSCIYSRTCQGEHLLETVTRPDSIDDADDFSGNTEFAKAEADYLSACKDVDEADAKKESALVAMKAIAGTSGKFKGADPRIKYYNYGTSIRRDLNREALKEEHPEIVKKYTVETVIRRFAPVWDKTKNKEGDDE